MAKKFNHAVIYNGVFYPANTPIEDEKSTTEASAPTGTENSEEAEEKAETSETEEAEKAAKNDRKRERRKSKPTNTD